MLPAIRPLVGDLMIFTSRHFSQDCLEGSRISELSLWQPVRRRIAKVFELFLAARTSRVREPMPIQARLKHCERRRRLRTRSCRDRISELFACRILRRTPEGGPRNAVPFDPAVLTCGLPPSSRLPARAVPPRGNSAGSQRSRPRRPRRRESSAEGRRHDFGTRQEQGGASKSDARRCRMAPLQGPRNSENHVASASSLLQHGAEFDGQRLRLTDIGPRLH